MYKKLLIASFLIMTALYFTSCYYDNVEDLYPVLPGEQGSTIPCDTTNVTYSATVKPIFDGNCNGCHSSGTFNFSTYSSLSVYLAANSQKLIDNISYTSAQHMPPSGKMNDCNIKKIMIWIQAGYPNN